MSRKTILYVMPTLLLDGPGQVLHGIVRHLDRSRFNAVVVGILAPRAGSWPDGRGALRGMGVDVIDLALPKPWDAFSVPSLVRVMRDIRPDVIHTQLVRADLYGQLAELLCHAPRLVSTVHYVEDWARSANPLWNCVRAFSGLMQRRVDCLVSVSESVQQDVLRVFGRRARRYEVILNGIEPTDPATVSPPSLASQLGWPAGTVTVLSVGRLHPRKNFDFLIDAFAQMLKATRAGAGLVIVGDGPLRQALQAKVMNLGIAEAVHFAGHRNDVPGLMRQADIFAICSHGEGLSIAALEAMDAGLPCVVTDVPGLNEAVRDGLTGCLVPPGNADACARALATLVQSPDRRACMGLAGRAEVLRCFTAEAMSQKYQELYLEC